MRKLVLTTIDPTNPCELGEIELYDTQSVTDTDFCIGLDTRFDAVRRTAPDWAYDVTAVLERAFIQLEVSGCRISREARAGDRAQPLSRETDTKVRQFAATTVSGKAAVSAGAGVSLQSLQPSAGASAKAEAQAGAKRHREANVEQRTRYKEIVQALTSLPRGRWVVQDIRGDELRGRYAPEDHLCKLETKDVTGLVRGTLSFYPKDLKLNLTENDAGLVKRLTLKHPNKASLAQALLAKELRDLNRSGAADGRVVLGSSVVTFRLENDQQDF
jgi:hypothetical protein